MLKLLCPSRMGIARHQECPAQQGSAGCCEHPEIIAQQGPKTDESSDCHDSCAPSITRTLRIRQGPINLSLPSHTHVHLKPKTTSPVFDVRLGCPFGRRKSPGWLLLARKSIKTLGRGVYVLSKAVHMLRTYRASQLIPSYCHRTTFALHSTMLSFPDEKLQSQLSMFFLSPQIPEVCRHVRTQKLVLY